MTRFLKFVTAVALALAPTVIMTQPAHATGSTWSTVSTGAAHTCAIRTSQALYCWGSNGMGQLGTGDFATRKTPRHIGTSDWLSVSAGVFTTCAIGTSHLLYCWGDNNVGPAPATSPRG